VNNSRSWANNSNCLNSILITSAVHYWFCFLPVCLSLLVVNLNQDYQGKIRNQFWSCWKLEKLSHVIVQKLQYFVYMNYKPTTKTFSKSRLERFLVVHNFSRALRIWRISFNLRLSWKWLFNWFERFCLALVKNHARVRWENKYYDIYRWRRVPNKPTLIGWCCRRENKEI